MTRPSAAVVLLVADGLVLSVSRKGRPAEKGLPGGKVEDGEEPEDAARRELLEETGVRVGKLDLVFGGIDDTGVYVVAFRAANVVGPMEPPSKRETGTVEWLPPSELVSSSPFAEFNAALFAAVGIRV